MSLAAQCVACGGNGSASAVPPVPEAPNSPQASSSITESGTVAEVDKYGSKNPMIVVDSGSPYEEIDVYMKGAEKFKVGEKVRAKGTLIHSPPNRLIEATSIVVTSGSPTPTPTDTPTPRSTPTPRPTPTPTGATDSVINVIVMENESTEAIIGSSRAPFINSLLAKGAYFSNAHGVGHPSLPNYLALFSGSTDGVSDDHCPPASGGYTNLNLAQQVAVGSSVEDAPANLRVCSSDTVGPPPDALGLYQGHHVPWAYFSTAPVRTRPTGKVNFYIPNDCDNMHDSCGGNAIAHGDAWLKSHWPHGGVVILLWDEAGSGSEYDANHVPLIIVGNGISPHTDGKNVNDCAVLKWIELQERVPLLGCAVTAATISP